ncbi:transglutaminase domain-containing protein [Chitinophaga qingshengii]|uniref:Transglutaminase-like domain-containing protein n=1 Tax=Chitinophaga qingshengii TaxID=1569794 RepID=A0ABR7TRU0_9BACT|nr:transglutaminase domain-containing protein [Chitinophaga qingshengii]MBC9933196.1 hypothetical protein [Chitinophaga qingshengii]
MKDFTEIDSTARTVRYHGELYTLTHQLTDPYPDQLSKTRALFIWVTHNIAYDYKGYNRLKEDRKSRRQETEEEFLRRVLKRRKAVCEGYARLFRKLCSIAGIRCEVVAGYTKTKPYQIGNLGIADHAWNAVYLDTAWFTMDPTWAAGSCGEDEETGKLTPFKREFNNYYWQASDKQFHRNHYPEDKKWVFENSYTKDKFKAAPYISATAITDLELISPAEGIIQARKGDTIHFRFRYRDRFEYLQVNSNVSRNPAVRRQEKLSRRRSIWVTDTVALRKQRYISFRKQFTQYEFDYVVTDEYVTYLDILFDYERAFRYKVMIDRTPVSAGK